MNAVPRTVGRALTGAVLLTLPVAHSGQAPPQPLDCPQPRFTDKAPDEYYARKNPIDAGALDVAAAERLYTGPRGKIGCATCHGTKGDGKGPMSDHFNPPPRNFACANTIIGIPDGQLFWVIRFGSPGTAMPPHRDLSDQQVWHLVAYLRHLAR